MNGKEFESARIRSGKSIRWLAKYLGHSTSTIWRWEHDTYDRGIPSKDAEEIMRLARVAELEGAPMAQEHLKGARRRRQSVALAQGERAAS